MTVFDGKAEPGSRRTEARRLGDAMRLVIERLVGTSAPAEELAAAADQLAAVAAALEPYPQGRIYDGFAESANSGDPHAFFDWSPILGRANPLAPPMTIEEIEGRVIARISFGSAYEGPPGCVHGGYIAAAFDEVLGLANNVSGMPAMTGTLNIRYRKPTPIHRELRCVAYLDKISGRKVSTRGELWDGEVLTAEAEGLFIRVGSAKFEELMAARSRNSSVRE
jgi:acyl-coenzyme A thioesterase PaaI-like protein